MAGGGRLLLDDDSSICGPSPAVPTAHITTITAMAPSVVFIKQVVYALYCCYKKWKGGVVSRNKHPRRMKIL